MSLIFRYQHPGSKGAVPPSTYPRLVKGGGTTPLPSGMLVPEKSDVYNRKHIINLK